MKSLVGDQSALSPWLLDLTVAAKIPFYRVCDNPCANHIEIYIDEALQKMPPCLHRRRMITILPKGTFSVFPLVVLLACPSGYKLYRSWNRHSITVICHEQVDVIRSYDVVQYHQPIAFLGLPQPLQIPATVLENFSRNSLLWHRCVMCQMCPAM